MKHWKVFLVILCIMSGFGAYLMSQLADISSYSTQSAISIVLLAIPSFLFLVISTGWRRGLLIIAALWLTGTCIEAFGILTGFPYGKFIYPGGTIGAKIADVVPWTVGFAWAPLVIGSYVLSGNILQKAPLWQRISGGAIILVLFDAVLDPAAVALQYWEYFGTTQYYGVPLTNFGGWMISGTIGNILLHQLRGTSTLVPGAATSFLMQLSFWTVICMSFQLWIPATIGILSISFYGGRLLFRGG
jgi:putative membrane protein